MAVAERVTQADVARDPDALIRWHAVRARAHARLGDVGAAERLAAAALDAAEAIDMWDDQAIALRAAAEVHDRAGRRAEARAHVERALELCARKGDEVFARRLRTWLTELDGADAGPGAAMRS